MVYALEKLFREVQEQPQQLDITTHLGVDVTANGSAKSKGI